VGWIGFELDELGSVELYVAYENYVSNCASGFLGVFSNFGHTPCLKVQVDFIE